MRPITPLQPNIIRYLVEQNKWTELTNHIMDLQSRVGLLEVIVADQEWRPIETAPKDEVILIFHPGYGPVVAAWVMRAWRRVGRTESQSLSTNYLGATHWMPLPKAPTR